MMTVDRLGASSHAVCCARCKFMLLMLLGSSLGGVHLAVARGAQLLKSLRPQVEALWGAINQRGILLPAVFVFLWQVCNVVDSDVSLLKIAKSYKRTFFLSLQACLYTQGPAPYPIIAPACTAPSD